MKNSIISVRGLTKSYKRGSEKILALNDVSFDVPRGEFIAITGASGSGKTTLLNLLGCLDVPTAGSIIVDGKEVSKLPEKELVNIRRKNIGFVFQQFFLLPTLTVMENIALPLMFTRQNHSQEKLSRIIDIVGLKGRTEHLPNQLSGGEMQRVAIGRALINEPKIVFADEPTGNLDSATAQRIFDLFHSLCRDGISLIVVTHNPELAAAANGIINLKDGKISEISDFLKSDDTCGATRATVN
jgi:putative ABC transport system ATP-binding protein